MMVRRVQLLLDVTVLSDTKSKKEVEMYNVVIGTKYTSDGQERTRWNKVGEAYDTNNGMSLRLDVAILQQPGSIARPRS